MLSRKVSAAGMASVGGIDRGRVGERLQAALAGLHELHLLKEKQGNMVSWALRMDREEPTTSAKSLVLVTEEQRLEATLTALKQQLSRLRRQDVGLKTHLQQLDQQISELKLDVSKASTEQQESDSRPSSGFYELSDAGSCSLSNSCTSVYSECLSSSQASLLQSPASPASPHQPSPPAPADVCRRRSADESAESQPTLPRPAGLHLGSSRIRTGATRPRPVSTGDLERMLMVGPGCYKSMPGKSPMMGPVPRTSVLDSKFQSSLKSRSGTEVYHFPSPLHAVALQSPIFSLAGEPATTDGHGPPADALFSPDDLQKNQGRPESKHLGYIDKLLQRNTTRTCIQSEAGRDTLWIHTENHLELSDGGTVHPSVETRGVPLQPVSTGAIDTIQPDDKWERRCSQEQVNRTTHHPPVKGQVPESFQRYSYPAAVRECGSGEVNTSTTGQNFQAEYAAAARSNPESRRADVRETRGAEKRGPGKMPVFAHSSSAEDHPGSDARAGGPTAPTDFVHAKFVPAGSQRVKVRQADRKPKAVKLRRKAVEKKPRGVRLQHGYTSGERAREGPCGGGKGEGEPRRPGKVKTGERPSPRLGEQRRHSGSDSSLCAPGFMCSHRGHPKSSPLAAVTKSGKSRRPQRPEPEQPAELGRRRQGACEWPVDGEMLQATCTQRAREPYTHAMGSRQMGGGAASRPHLGQRVGHPRAFKPPVSSSCFYNALNARYPPAPYAAAAAGRYPPRCESEYSAECASLFHSTIAASSEGELSDDTTNRFGDSESSRSSRSHSDTSSSLSLEEEDEEEAGALVWAESALGPTAAGMALQQPPRPEPPACRIKASRALKKKIRRFQPASLKVMTLV